MHTKETKEDHKHANPKQYHALALATAANWVRIPTCLVFLGDLVLLVR